MLYTIFSLIEKDALPTHDISNLVYMFKSHRENGYIRRISQRFDVRRDGHIKESLNGLFLFRR